MSSRNVINLALGVVTAGILAVTSCPLLAEEAAPEEGQSPANAGPAQAPEQEAEVNRNDPEAFQAIGMMASKQLHLDVGFSDQEIDWILAGMKLGLSGQEFPESYKDDIGRARAIYRAQMAKVMDERKAEADEQEKLAQAYIDALPDKADLTCTDSGLYYKIIDEGDVNNKPDRKDKVIVKYTGTLIDGSVFDSNDKGAEFVLGGVVPGFKEGIQLIGQGGKIRLYVPGKLAYGLRPPEGSPIKPGAMLVFDIELDQVVKSKATPKNFPGNLPNAKQVGNMKTPPPPPTSRPPSTPPPLPPELANLKVPPPPPDAVKEAMLQQKAKAAAAAAKTDEESTEDTDASTTSGDTTEESSEK